jgi:hypothetical protein
VQSRCEHVILAAVAENSQHTTSVESACSASVSGAWSWANAVLASFASGTKKAIVSRRTAPPTWKPWWPTASAWDQQRQSTIAWN